MRGLLLHLTSCVCFYTLWLILIIIILLFFFFKCYHPIATGRCVRGLLLHLTSCVCFYTLWLILIILKFFYATIPSPRRALCVGCCCTSLPACAPIPWPSTYGMHPTLWPPLLLLELTAAAAVCLVTLPTAQAAPAPAQAAAVRLKMQWSCWCCVRGGVWSSLSPGSQLC